MKKIVRIGKIEAQDRWRRDDLLTRTPNERVEMLVQLQADYFAGIKIRFIRRADLIEAKRQAGRPKDLAFLLDIYSLPDMMTFYMEKYSDGNCFHVLKSLVFFNDAEDDPMPVMLRSLDWESAKEVIISAVTEFQLLK